MTNREFEQIEKLVTASGGVDNSLGFEGKRAIIGTAQKFLKGHGFDPGPIDGYYGPQTEFAVESYYNDEDEVWERPDQVADEIPTYANIESVYGKPGDKSNLILAKSPYPLKIAWNTAQSTTNVRCHVKVKDSIERVLNKVLDHYGLEKIQKLGLDMYGGCFNFRKMRGGSKYSTHSWGIAIDWDPANNRLKWGSDRARFAKPEYDFWWKCWEEEGWVSLGRERSFDFMHCQRCRL